jgi:hypothetical protein
VKNLVLFLNELSFASSLSSGEMLPHVFSTLSALKAARKIRNDLVLVGHVTLAGILLGDGTQSLAAILRGDTCKEEWRFLSSLMQLSPWDACPNSVIPGELREILFEGESGIGMLWALANNSVVVSFAFPPRWGDSHMRAQFHEIDSDGNSAFAEVTIRNVSAPQHSEVHRHLFENYGRNLAASSLIYEGNGFVIRMWFNDHPPPHFHVLTRRDTSESLARFAIETLDVLSGNVPPGIRKRVQEWARDRRQELMTNWERCANRRLPFIMED